jgi:ketosteroid isomerase-like protein
MSQQNIGLVQRGYEAFGRGDMDTFISLLDPNVEWTTPGPSDLPTAGTRRGHAQVREFFGALAALVDFEHFEPKAFLADGDHVVVLGLDRVKVKGTGETVTEEWCHVFTIRNGKVATFHEYLDMSAIAAALKAAPAGA